MIAIEADGKHESNKQKLYTIALSILSFYLPMRRGMQVLEIDIIVLRGMEGSGPNFVIYLIGCVF